MDASARRITVRVLDSTLGAHELIFRLAAQSGLFHPLTRLRIADLAEQYHALRLAADAEGKRGTPIPDDLRDIGSPADFGAMPDIQRVAAGEDHT